MVSCAYRFFAGFTQSKLYLSQTKQAGEAQAKYERELMLHAADVEVLKELKKALQQDAERKREIEDQLNKSNSLLEEKTTGWTTLEKQLKVGRSTQELLSRN